MHTMLRLSFSYYFRPFTEEQRYKVLAFVFLFEKKSDRFLGEGEQRIMEEGIPIGAIKSNWGWFEIWNSSTCVYFDGELFEKINRNLVINFYLDIIFLSNRDFWIFIGSQRFPPPGHKYPIPSNTISIPPSPIYFKPTTSNRKKKKNLWKIPFPRHHLRYII